MTPAVGQIWRTAATRSLFRIAEIDLSRPCDCVRLELVEPGPDLVSDWEAQATTAMFSQPGYNGSHAPDPIEVAKVREAYIARPFWVELKWFEHGAATFVRRAA